MSKILDVTDMIPDKWGSKCRRYRYILSFDGIDAFLLKGNPNTMAQLCFNAILLYACLHQA
jgi:hypothetical protein